ncbi:MAG: protoheme IX farnesyltransferase [Chloroflexi bacterium]|nr:MAG: protoheme IX farnesyltransferase [Chloroflexota bacterium]
MSVAVGIETPVAVPERALRALARDYLSLTKPRIIVLLEVTAFAAMVMAARGWPGTWRVVVTLLGGALAAGGANTINMWFDRDIDRTMTRTCGRPIASGRIGASAALGFGIGLGVAGFAELALFANLLAAVLATSALLFYVLVYTMYLKRSTIQNIVIGGAAGAVPPLVGWAAVTGRLDVPALFLFAVVFYWTPPHFWALSLLMQRDYTLARVPMLPVVVGSQATRVHIVLWTLILLIVTVLPFLAHSFGWVYLAGAVVLNGVFLVDALRLLADPSPRAASRLFHYSLLYLALLFTVMAVDRVVIPG